MKFTIKSVDLFGVKSKLNSIQNNRQLGTYMAETCARYMDPYVPFLSGTLSTSYTTKPNLITYDTPYAKKQFYDTHLIHPNTSPHPLASAHWDEPMKKAKGKQLAKDIEAFMKRI